MNVISAIFALLGIVAFIVDLNLNGLYRSGFDYYSYLVLVSRGKAVPQLPLPGWRSAFWEPSPSLWHSIWMLPEPLLGAAAVGLFPSPVGEPRAGGAHVVGSGTRPVSGWYVGYWLLPWKWLVPSAHHESSEVKGTEQNLTARKGSAAVHGMSGRWGKPLALNCGVGSAPRS